MLGLLIYLVVTVFAGFILSFFWLTMRSTKVRGDASPYPALFFCMMIAVLGPFAYVEILTRAIGSNLESAIKTAFRESPVKGKFQYYRVTNYTGKGARALVVGEERVSWGGTDRPVVGVDLEKDGEKWKAVSFKVIYSDRLNKDGLVVPPYR